MFRNKPLDIRIYAKSNDFNIDKTIVWYVYNHEPSYYKITVNRNAAVVILDLKISTYVIDEFLNYENVNWNTRHSFLSILRYLEFYTRPKSGHFYLMDVLEIYGCLFYAMH